MMDFGDWIAIVSGFASVLIAHVAAETLINWLFYVPVRRRLYPSEIDGVENVVFGVER